MSDLGKRRKRKKAEKLVEELVGPGAWDNVSVSLKGVALQCLILEDGKPVIYNLVMDWQELRQFVSFNGVRNETPELIDILARGINSDKEDDDEQEG